MMEIPKERQEYVAKRFAVAQALSNQMVDVLNKERQRMITERRVDPMQMVMALFLTIQERAG